MKKRRSVLLAVAVLTIIAMSTVAVNASTLRNGLINDIFVNLESMDDGNYTYGDNCSAAAIGVNKSTLPDGNWTWAVQADNDNKKYTLKLNGYNGKSVFARTGISWDGKADVDVVLELTGNNVIVGNEYGIRLDTESLTIKGTGKLSVNASSNDSYPYAYGITANRLCIESGSIEVKAKGKTSVRGIKSSTDLVINGGNITSKATGSGSGTTYGLIAVEGNIYINGGTVKVFGTGTDSSASLNKTPIFNGVYDITVGATESSKAVVTKVTDTTFTGNQYAEIVFNHKFVPEIINGKDSTWKSDSKDGLVISSNADIDDFIAVLVDGKEITAEKYTVKGSGTIVTLSPEYLATLEAGKHTLTIQSTTGSAATEITIEKATINELNPPNQDIVSPKTGDANNITFLLLLLIVAVSAVAYTEVKKKQ